MTVFLAKLAGTCVTLAGLSSEPLRPAMPSTPPRFFIAATALLVAGCKPSGPGKTVPGDSVDFNRDIQPVLAERCYHCHGPDSGSRKSGLRLDLAETAFAKRPGKADAIVPGKPDASELIRRIAAHDGAVMPPREAVEKPLSPEQIEIFRKWIAQGAKYRPHWAFEKPVRPPVPVVAGVSAANPIDAFILAKLAEQKLTPNPEADKATLLRRVTLDLTGLLPTPAEVDTFLADASPGAYEKVVDRLLASTAYGEHRARYWLDYARYGDTHGLHLDNYRSIWPYRDYVIKAFNTNKPFDRFVTEQLAGDLSAPTDIDALVATGFIRAGIASGEGGTLVEELRVNNKRERTEAYGAVFMGMTVGCANCHDHKFDPTSQKDFYALTAFFNNLTEKPSHNDRADWAPYVKVPKPDKLAAYNIALAIRSGVQRDIAKRRSEAAGLVKAWLAGDHGVKPASTEALRLRLRLDENKGVEFFNSAPSASPKSVKATGGAPTWGEDTWFWPSFRMDSSTRIEIADMGDVGRDAPFSAGTWFMPRLETAASGTPDHGAILSRMDSADGSKGWSLHYAGGKISLMLVAKWPDDAVVVETKDAVVARGRWDHVFVTHDGSGKAAGVKIYVNGVARETVVKKDTLTGDIRTKAPFLVGRRAPDAETLRQSRYQDLRFYARALPPEEASRVAYADRVTEVIAKPADKWDDDEAKVVADYYFANVDPVMRELVAKISPLDTRLAEASKDGDLTLVCEESPRLAYADVLGRGDYGSRLERVRPATPHFLPGLPKGVVPDRAALAAWTVDPENPLTARVTVNRIWNEIFGTGIVATTDDFGIMGDRPTHPELLDWLAVEFRESGWDVKKFYRLLVTSAAYKRSSKVTPELLESDPRNRLLARGPRYRMDAEVLRDTALQAAGLLSPKIGGPSVKPYQPPGVWEAVSYPSSNTLHYKQDSGEGLYRRSVYSFWKRQAILPDLETFDAPVRDATCTRRARTNTPLQALVTMNDPQWVEAAKFLAVRALREGGATSDSRFDFLARTLLAKPFPPALKKPLADSLEKFRKRFAADPKAAAELLAVGEKPLEAAPDPVELASWMLVASEMLNLDKTLNK